MLKPLKDYVVIEKVKAEATTSSGILLPQTSKEEKNIGNIVAVGTGKVLSNGERITLEVKVGDKVLYSKYGATEIELDSKQYIVIREEDILGIIS